MALTGENRRTRSKPVFVSALSVTPLSCTDTAANLGLCGDGLLHGAIAAYILLVFLVELFLSYLCPGDLSPCFLP
jgi:hypothetical protein